MCGGMQGAKFQDAVLLLGFPFLTMHDDNDKTKKTHNYFSFFTDDENDGNGIDDGSSLSSGSFVKYAHLFKGNC